MSLNSVKILKISITTDSRQKILEEIRKYLTKSSKLKVQSAKLTTEPLIIVTPNPEQIVLAQKNQPFANILNRADVAVPDGIGVVWASKILAKGHPPQVKSVIGQPIPGVELMEDLVKMAAEEGAGIALIGGRAGLAIQALDRLQQKYSGPASPARPAGGPTGGLLGWAEDGPEIVDLKLPSDYVSQLVKKIVSTKTRIVFVGLGAPKQEFFIDQLRAYLLNLKWPLIIMAVGGSFEILAGKIPRAPFVLRQLGLEWFWRLIREPWRWRRQLALLKFMWLVMRAYWGKRT